MKLMSFQYDGKNCFGVLLTDGVANLTSASCTSLRQAIATWGTDGLRKRAAATKARIPLEEIDWLQPIVDPEKIICVGLNYGGHTAEAGQQAPTKPSLFVRFPSAQVGHDQPIGCPFVSETFDFEGELAVVIGRPARHVSAEQALGCVAGYSCFAENSVRDFQKHSRQATAGKNFEHSGAFGPYIVTTDEIPDPSQLTLITRLNGVEVQNTKVSDLIFAVPELIAHFAVLYGASNAVALERTD